MAEGARVYVVDDHEGVRQALVARLRGLPGVLVVGETGRLEQALAEIRALRPDVVVVEPKRADGQGIGLIHQILCLEIGIPVIVLTSYPNEWERREAERLGAVAYLLKDLGSAALEAEIRRLIPPRPPEDEHPAGKAS
jgi:two-component system response regulator DevR